jgi:hypothetical protein
VFLIRIRIDLALPDPVAVKLAKKHLLKMILILDKDSVPRMLLFGLYNSK